MRVRWWHRFIGRNPAKVFTNIKGVIEYNEKGADDNMSLYKRETCEGNLDLIDSLSKTVAEQTERIDKLESLLQSVDSLQNAIYDAVSRNVDEISELEDSVVMLTDDIVTLDERTQSSVSEEGEAVTEFAEEMAKLIERKINADKAKKGRM